MRSYLADLQDQSLTIRVIAAKQTGVDQMRIELTTGGLQDLLAPLEHAGP